MHTYAQRRENERLEKGYSMWIISRKEKATTTVVIVPLQMDLRARVTKVTGLRDHLC